MDNPARSFRGRAFAVSASILLVACISLDVAAHQVTHRGGGGDAVSPARVPRVTHRRALAADDEAPIKRVPGDYSDADADADAVLWEPSPPAPVAKAPFPVKPKEAWTPPPRLSPSPPKREPPSVRSPSPSLAGEPADAEPADAEPAAREGKEGKDGKDGKETKETDAVEAVVPRSKEKSKEVASSRLKSANGMEADRNAIEDEKDTEEEDASVTIDAAADLDRVSEPSSARAGAPPEPPGSPEPVGVEARGNAGFGLASDGGGGGTTKRFVFGGVLALSTGCLAGAFFQMKKQMDDSRPHSSIELGSSSFKRLTESGTPAERAEPRGEKNASKESRLGKKRGAGAPVVPRGFEAGRTGTNVGSFGNSGSSRRGTKSWRETARTEDGFYS